MALYERQITESADEQTKIFKDFVAEDIDDVFFNMSEFADMHTVDGKEALIVLHESDVREHEADSETKRTNRDAGIYVAHTLMYIKVSDYGNKPKSGKQLILDGEDIKRRRAFIIRTCDEQMGVYKMTMERMRQ